MLLGKTIIAIALCALSSGAWAGNNVEYNQLQETDLAVMDEAASCLMEAMHVFLNPPFSMRNSRNIIDRSIAFCDQPSPRYRIPFFNYLVTQRGMSRTGAAGIVRMLADAELEAIPGLHLK